MTWVDQLKEYLPEYAKDIRSNLDAVINGSEIDPEYGLHLSIASAFSAGNVDLLNFIVEKSTNEIERDAALGAGAIMAQNNIWYPYNRESRDQEFRNVNGQLRMNTVSSQGGTSKDKFEAYCLAASIVAQCNYSISRHFDVLKGEGYTYEQLREIGRIAATINSISKIFKK